MSITTVLAAALAVSANVDEAVATAQQDPPAAEAPVQASSGVTSYPADFFVSAQPNSAMDMIVRIPGFSFDGGDQVRGYGGAAGNVLIDGQRPASKSEGLEDALRRIQAKQVLRIDIIRGGAPGIDMQGKTVIANIILRKDVGGTWLVAVASALHQDGRTTPAMRFEGSRPNVMGGTFTWSNLVFTFVDDGAGEGVQRSETNLGVVERTAWDETAGGRGADLKAGWKGPAFGGQISLNTRGFFERYQWSLNASEQAGPGRLQINDQNDREQGELSGSWEKLLTPKMRLELTGVQTLQTDEFSSYFDDGADNGLYSEVSDRGESIGRVSLRYTFNPNVILEGGAEVAFNSLESETSFVANGVPVVLPTANVRVEEERAEAFTTLNWRFNPKFAIEAGLKVEQSTISQSGDTNLSKSFTYAKPRLIATWSPTGVDQVRVRIEREVGQLNFRDFVSNISFSSGGTVTAGGADLVPAQATVFELAYERKFWNDGAIVLKYTHEEISDAIDRIRVLAVPLCPLVAGVPDTSSLDCNFDAPGNIGEGTNDVFSVGLTLPLNRFGVPGGLLKINGAWKKSEVIDPTTGNARRISGQAPFEGEIRFSQDLPKYKVNWGVDAFLAFEERYFRFDRVDQIELETWVAAYAEWKPRPDFAIRIEAQNLLGRDFTRQRWLYDAPRDVGSVYYYENRSLDFPSFIYIRLRKTFG